MELRLLRYFVAVAEERHFGRAAERLHMTQPPLSRAIKQLEAEVSAQLLRRSATGVALTPAGAVLYERARALLDQAERARADVAAEAGAAAITVGTLADSAEQAGPLLAAAYRERHPRVRVRVREADFADPTGGLRAGLVDVALTRAPFDTAGISVRVLRADPVGAILRADDPLAARPRLRVADLADRPWFRLPEGADPVWSAYWTPAGPGGAGGAGPVVRTAQECLQAVLWNGTVGMAPLTRTPPEGLAAVPLADMPPSRLVVAWNRGDANSAIRAFIRVAAELWGGAAR
ncbi:LysR family transcriptional regulator [Streptomonospora nanhaiensis]|uniref:DNA-binding transcriptional LysR family regulator n=1 Tax=Streptomonospora nanhaiensis TaxID=1323731 RepID=A0A853BKV4_9ACTN|nr:LysR substrate-binding domain-containing protein [Streptomonospora nanhaiensis]MBV2364219.1 LysR family transcriptional regulator [Streptomonospora nanhaiensis]MBX9386661.1 LysR family transcriptional regulator [Streptomonospora nanhaiensis]NYI95176.1 DNA-binding transcriptional LysR family regulator [Streptomonospora nanhaiensis]